MDYAKPLYQLLRESGGSPDAVGNYSGAAESFFFAPAAGELVALRRMLIFIEDGGSFDSGLYGNGLALTNGITINVKDAGGLLFTLTPEPIKTNGGWDRMHMILMFSPMARVTNMP